MDSAARVAHLAPLGERRDLPGNAPLALADAERCWVVAAGRVDVFAVAAVTGADVEGPRHYLFSATTGDALFGVAADATAAGLLAVGVPGTEVIELSRAALDALRQEDEGATLLAALLDGWVTALLIRQRPGLPPATSQPVNAGAELTIDAEVSLSSAGGVVWCQAADPGALRLFGAAAEAAGAVRAIPLCPDAWIQCAASTAVAVLDTTTALRDSGWVLLADLSRRLQGWIAAELVAETAAAERRLAARRELDEEALEQAYRQIAAVFGDAASAESGAPAPPDDLLAACQSIGRHLGVEFHAPPPAGASQRSGEPLRDIAQASRLRHRRVALRGRWWREDNGPLLAFRRDGQAPVALLPTSVRSYELVDPVNNQRTAVGPDEAAALDPFAFTFFNTLPSRALGGRDVARLAFRGIRQDLVHLILMGVLVGLVGLATPVATGLLFDDVIPNAQLGYLAQLAIILLVCYLAVSALTFTRNIAVLRIEGRMDAMIQSAIWDRLLELPVPFFRRYTSGNLTMRAMGIDAIRQLISSAVVTSVLGSVFSVFNLALLFYYDWGLALVALGLIALAVVVTVSLSLQQLRYQRLLIGAGNRIAGLVQQLLGGVAKIRVAGAEDRAFAVWARAYSEQQTLSMSAGTIGNLLTSFNSGFSLIASTAVFGWVVFRGLGVLSTGEFLAFVAAFSAFLIMAINLSSSLVSVLNVIPYWEQLKPILEAVPEVNEARRVRSGVLAGRIDVNDLVFRYVADSAPVIDRVSLRFEPGEFVALVGPSGSGKSTLLRLLLGFEQPERGTVYYDQHDLATVDVRDVRRQIGVVLQTAQLLPGTIFDNIVGAANLSHEDALAAARLAGIEDDIKALPMGLNTMISEGSGGISGGQRQRLLIARALVHRPRILFFDEATSALDNQTQAVVSQSLDGLQATRLVIAHRLSTVRHADRIVVIEAGRVVEQGTYEELLARDGFFAGMARRQMF